MIKINIPDSSWSESRMSLDGRLYTIEFRHNSRDDRWRLDIYYQGEPVIRGLKLMENQEVTDRYILDNWNPNTYLIAVRMKNTLNLINRDNLGINKTYELYFIEDGDV